MCRTSAVVQVKPWPRIDSSSSSAQEARSERVRGQPCSVIAYSMTGTGRGPVTVLYSKYEAVSAVVDCRLEYLDMSFDDVLWMDEDVARGALVSMMPLALLPGSTCEPFCTGLGECDLDLEIFLFACSV